MSDSDDPKDGASDPMEGRDPVAPEGETVDLDEMKSKAQDAATKMVDELQTAFKKGREDAEGSFGTATEHFKEILEKGAYGMGFGGAFATQFVGTVLEDVMPDAVRKGAEEGATRGRKAGGEFKDKVGKTAESWKEKAKDAAPADDPEPDGAPA